MRSTLASLLAALLLAVPAAFAQEAKPVLPGTYEGDGLTLSLTGESGLHSSMEGTVTLGEQRFRLHFKGQGVEESGATVLDGTFEADGNRFPFVIKSGQAGAMTLESEGTVYRLKRRGVNPLAKPKKVNPLAANAEAPRVPAPSTPAPAAQPDAGSHPVARRRGPLAPPTPAGDPYVGTFVHSDGMTVTILGGPNGKYTAAVSDGDHKTTFPMVAAGNTLSGVMEEDGDKIAVEVTAAPGGGLKVTVDGETVAFSRQGSGADAPPAGPLPRGGSDAGQAPSRDE